MDIADLAQTQNEPIQELRIKVIRDQAFHKIPENLSGLCWTCDNPVPDLRRWCDKECADLYAT